MKYVLAMFATTLLIPTLSWAGAPEARKVAQSAPECKAIQPFYWEIGDASGELVGESIGGKYNRQSEMIIASASKWIFAAYYLEEKRGLLTAQDKSLLLMQGGYEEFNPLPCALRLTVEACFKARSNSDVNRDSIGKFYYSGGNAQALAVKMGLGSFTRRKLADEVQSKLKRKFGLSYSNLALAGGLEMSAAQYASFLQETLKGTYRLKDHLGQDAVCTSKCKEAKFSPAKEDWLYSYHHWVETAEKSKVEAYSSPGARGFYPWISADKKFYGVLAREENGRESYWDSVLCGRSIRRAFLK